MGNVGTYTNSYGPHELEKHLSGPENAAMLSAMHQAKGSAEYESIQSIQISGIMTG